MAAVEHHVKSGPVVAPDEVDAIHSSADQTPSLSVLIPVYRVAKYIERCVRSLFDHDDAGIEYVFVDDHTPDDSMVILERIIAEYPHLQARVKIRRHAENSGIAAVRNTLLASATGRYLWFVDSDDYVAPDAIRQIRTLLDRHAPDILVFGYCNCYDTRTARPVYMPQCGKEDFLIAILKFQALHSLWNKVFKRDLWIDHGVTFTTDCNNGEDWVVVPRLFYHAQSLAVSDLLLYNYVQYNPGAYTKAIADQTLSDLLTATKLLHDFFQTQANCEKYQNALQCGKVWVKLKLFRMTANSNLPNRRAQLVQIAALYPDLPTGFMVATASPPYKPIVILAALRCFGLIPIYSRLCRTLYAWYNRR